MQGAPQCAVCGDSGVFNGWLPSMSEAMAVYRYVFSLNPIGPHRPFADQLFAGLRSVCMSCMGRTVLTLGDGRAWSTCPVCEGTGGIWICSTELIEVARHMVLTRWPNAALTESAALVESMRRSPPSHVIDVGRRVVLTRGRPREGRNLQVLPEPVSRSRRRRQKGYSAHGHRFTDVVHAFALAERILGANWRLKGRGHCRRATLKAPYSNHAVKGAARSWTHVCPHQQAS